jgi:hypothetical protein
MAQWKLLRQLVCQGGVKYPTVVATGQHVCLDSARQCYPSSFTSGISDKVVRREGRITEHLWGGLDWDIKLYCQPANSPAEMNVKDLCFPAGASISQSHQFPSRNDSEATIDIRGISARKIE